jgi:hypothetical protein
MTGMQTSARRRPCCKDDDALDMQALVWVRATLNGTNASLRQSDSQAWGESSAERCNSCGWHGTVHELQVFGGTTPEISKRNMPSPQFSCPAEHTDGLQESHQLHVWYPVDNVTGEADCGLQHYQPLATLQVSLND